MNFNWKNLSKKELENNSFVSPEVNMKMIYD